MGRRCARAVAQAASGIHARPYGAGEAVLRAGSCVHRHQVAIHGVQTLGGGGIALGLAGDEAGGLVGGLGRDFAELTALLSTRAISRWSASSISPILASCASARPSCSPYRKFAAR